MRSLFPGEFTLWLIYRASYLFCKTVIQCQKQRSQVIDITERVSDKTDILLIWHSHFDCQLSFCRCPRRCDEHGIWKPHGDTMQMRGKRFDSTRHQVWMLKKNKKQLISSFLLFFARSAHGSQNVNIDCRVAGKITSKWNFIDSCL